MIEFQTGRVEDISEAINNTVKLSTVYAYYRLIQVKQMWKLNPENGLDVCIKDPNFTGHQ